MAFPIPNVITTNINSVADIEGFLSIAGTVTDIARNFLPSVPSVQQRRMEQGKNLQDKDVSVPSNMTEQKTREVGALEEQNKTGPAPIRPEGIGKFSTEKLRGLFAQHDGLAPSNRFQVELPDIKDMKLASLSNNLTGNVPGLNMEERGLLCTAVGLPGKQITVAQRQIGIDNRAMANGQTFGDVNLTFYLTSSYAIRKYFQYWMECVVSQTPGSPMVAGYYKNYIKDITIKQLSRYTVNSNSTKGTEDPKVLYTVKLIDAFPTNLEVIQLNNQAQTAALEMTVTISYRNYTTE